MAKLFGAELTPIKSLGVALSVSATKKPKQMTKDVIAAKEIQKQWGDYLGGPKIIAGSEEIQAMVEQWMSVPSGFAAMTMDVPHWQSGEMAPLDLDGYQCDLIDSDESYVCYNKSRRIGLSMASVARALVRAHLPNGIDSYYVSKNYDEAKDKISKYARELYFSMPKDLRLPLSSRSLKTRMDFESRDGRMISIVSHPQTEPRGMDGDFYLDEFACYIDQNAIYTAAQNATLRRGSIRIVTTPRIKDDLFYDICIGKVAFPKFKDSRYTIPWWHSRVAVRDGNVELAKVKCPDMATKDRVYQYGSDKLIAVYEGNASPELFAVEYECQFLDDATSFYPDTILSPSLFPMVDSEIASELLGDEAPYYPMDKKLKHLGVATRFYKTFQELRHGVDSEEIGKDLYMAVDPGFTDGCSVIVGERVGDDMLVIRFNNKYMRMGVAKREGIIMNMMRSLPIKKIAIDCKDGEGRSLAAKCIQVPSIGSHRVMEIKATAELNAMMAIDVRRLMETQCLAIPDYDPLKMDIKKVRTVFNKVGEPTIAVTRDKDGHGDRFYSLMYLVQAANMNKKRTIAVSSISVSDGKHKRKYIGIAKNADRASSLRYRARSLSLPHPLGNRLCLPRP